MAVGTSYQVQYVHHLGLGTTGVVGDTARWTVLWTAPSEEGGPVLLHAAGNAANDDGSQFGDYIYTGTASSRAASR